MTSDAIQPPQRPVGLLSLLGFLVGHRDSVRNVLELNHGIAVAAALVFTASLAREYDAVSLAHRPWDLLGSFAASIVLCTILFLVVNVCLWMVSRRSDNLVQDYRIFLTGYWMTAPLAWLYAIPVETFASEVDSVRFNLAALSIVSIWRVLLFSRVLSILYAIPFYSSLLWVLAPCMVIAFGFLLSAIMPMVSIMGGIRMTETQTIVFNYQNKLLEILFFSAIPVLILFLTSFPVLIRYPSPHEPIAQTHRQTGITFWAVPCLVFALLLVGCYHFQPKYWRSTKIDALLTAGRFSEAIALLRTCGPDTLPISWDPPPRFSSRETPQPEMVGLLEALIETQSETWINDSLLVQADEIILRQAGWTQGARNFSYLSNMLPYESPETLERLRDAFEKLRSLSLSDPAAQQRADQLAELVAKAIEDARKETQTDTPSRRKKRGSFWQAPPYRRFMKTSSSIATSEPAFGN
jgi:hypothetical protein